MAGRSSFAGNQYVKKGHDSQGDFEFRVELALEADTNELRGAVLCHFRANVLIWLLVVQTQPSEVADGSLPADWTCSTD